MRHPTQLWHIHEPGAEHALGFIPGFLDPSDARSAREQLNERYLFGGWSPFGAGQWNFNAATGTLCYPGDPPLFPIASTRLHDEMVIVYLHGLVAIVLADGSFEVARLD